MALRALFLFLMVFLSKGAVSQPAANTKMELKELIYNEALGQDFVLNKLADISLSKMELLQANHPLLMQHINKVLLPLQRTVTIFGQPVAEVYGYQPEGEKARFALYLLMELDQQALDSIVRELGHPINIPFEDYQSGDYDFLHWMCVRRIDITIMPSAVKFGGDNSPPETVPMIMTITNMDYKDLRNLSPIE